MNTTWCDPPNPKVRQLLDRPGDWELCEDLTVHDGSLSFVVPHGFVFDYASVPRIVRPLIQTTDLSSAPPAAHDWLYRKAGRVPATWGEMLHYNRERADDLFDGLMQFTRVKGWRRWAAMRAVRIGGASAWGGRVAEVLSQEEASCP